MDKITQLTQEIEALETQAGALQVDDYEELYKILVVAYFKAKDINELHSTINPVLNQDMVEELAAANDLIKLQRAELDAPNDIVEGLLESIENLKVRNQQMSNTLVSIEKVMSR